MECRKCKRIFEGSQTCPACGTAVPAHGGFVTTMRAKVVLSEALGWRGWMATLAGAAGLLCIAEGAVFAAGLLRPGPGSAAALLLALPLAAVVKRLTYDRRPERQGRYKQRAPLLGLAVLAVGLVALGLGLRVAAVPPAGATAAVPALPAPAPGPAADAPASATPTNPPEPPASGPAPAAASAADRP